MIRHILRYLGTLLALQVVFGGVAFLLSDYRWLSVPVGLLFVGLVWGAGRSLAWDLDRGRGPTALAALAAGLLWQLPGLQGTLRYVSDTAGWTSYDGITDLQDFLMETWHTVLMPALAALPYYLVDDYYALYYIALVWLSPLLILLFVLAALWPARRSGRS